MAWRSASSSILPWRILRASSKLAAAGRINHIGHKFLPRNGGGTGRAIGRVEIHLDVVDADGITAGAQKRFAQDVLQLPHIARPRLFFQLLERIGLDDRLGDLQRFAMPAQEVLDEEGNIFAPVAQGWQGERRHVEAIEQILAKAAGGDGPFEIDMSRRDDADVDLDVFPSADTRDGFFLQDAEELRLCAHGKLADSSRKSVPLSACSKRPMRRTSAPVKAPFSWPKSSLSSSVSGDGGAIDGDEGFLQPVAEAHEGAGDEFLAGAGFASDQDGDRLGGDAPDFLVDVLHAGRAPDDRVALRDFAFQFDGARGEAAGGHRLVDEIEHFARGKGFIR